MSFDMEIDTDSKRILVMQSALLKTIDDTNKAWAEINALKKIIITGNGNTSLVEQVRDATKFINDWKDDVKWIKRMIIGIVLGGSGAVVLTFIKVYPLLEKIANGP